MKVRFKDGQELSVNSLEEARSSILARFPTAHLEMFPDRGVAWPAMEDSVDDDGSKAVAQINLR
ncbi:MAG: hypothetical protein SFY81_06325 [Verrucomicrobiota bacterium]|nr:hypothetical protein [Verrucomicrobiota bacterium]